MLGLLALTPGAWADDAPTKSPSDRAWEDKVQARDDRIDDLERKVDVLVEELASLRTQVAVPDEPGLKSRYGLGPAASKIYGVERGLSIGGYGEWNYTNFVGDLRSGGESMARTFSNTQLDRADALRLVMYTGYKFSDRIIFNSEIEFEHGSTGGSTASSGSGSVSVEFAAMDFMFNDRINARGGLLLLPMGFINEIHEPPFFHGVRRPETERRIIPTTWREMGAGIFGRLHEDVEYRAYVTSGFNAAGFSDSGIRGGRQQGNRALSEDLAAVARMDWTPGQAWLLGGSFYIGNSGQNQRADATGEKLPGNRLIVWEAHAQYRKNQLEARALVSMNLLADAGDLNHALDRPSDRPIADQMLGGYGEVAYDLWPTIFGNGERYLAPFLRIEYVDTQLSVPRGYIANDRNRYWLYTPGVTFKPHPNVVLKLEYRNFAPKGSAERPDELSLGMGFAF